MVTLLSTKINYRFERLACVCSRKRQDELLLLLTGSETVGLKEKAVRGSVINSLRSVLEAGLSLLAFFTFARLLQPGDFGLYALAIAIVALLQTVNDLGMMRALVQRKSLSDYHRNTAFWSIFVVSVGLYLLIATGAGLFAWLFAKPALTTILPVLALGLLMQGYSETARGLLLRNMQFDFIAVVSLLSTAAGVVAGIAMAYDGWGIWSLVVYRLTITFVGSVTYWYGLDWRPRFSFSGEPFYQLLNYGKNIAGRNFLRRLGTRLDDLIIGYVLGTYLLGFYTVAFRVMSLTGELLVGSLSSVAMPLFSRLQSEKQRLQRAVISALKLSAAVALPVYATLIVLGHDFLILMFGLKWQPSVPLLRILLISGLAVVVTKFMVVLLEAMDRAEYDFYLTLAETLLVALGFSLLAPLGLGWASVAYTGIKYLLLPVTLWLGLSLVGLSTGRLLKALAHPVLGSLLIYVVLSVLNSYQNYLVPGYGSLILRGTGGLAIYGVYLRIFAPDILGEMFDLFRQLFRRSGTDVFLS